MNVQARVRKASAALAADGVLYAVAGGNAVALWVSRIDPGAVRATPDVDILIRRVDFERAKLSLERVGYIHRYTDRINAFLEPPGDRFRDAVHILFAGEKVREQEMQGNPDVSESEQGEEFRVLSLDAIVRIKLTAFRRKDQVHLLDMIDVGLIDTTWLNRLPQELSAKLQILFDSPEGWASCSAAQSSGAR